ncbi:hypothetical protein EGR_11015 [Echinococcus granulosus]|uniref:Uncharacterized protein n=1 Tax=Echinococcus granulosus TaxID=6210 RepID=W6TZI2_ECHGR|nr:hypothetical protein EGR_11015 [Echinococcus granulosus]EUB54128.1 hypothetical protein EGR_11015 [Echinococcus granulosus]
MASILRKGTSFLGCRRLFTCTRKENISTSDQIFLLIDPSSFTVSPPLHNSSFLPIHLTLQRPTSQPLYQSEYPATTLDFYLTTILHLPITMTLPHDQTYKPPFPQ